MDQHQLVHHLLGRDLLSIRSVVEGRLVIQDWSRRNRNFRVTCEGDQSYLVKQGTTRENAMSLAREAECCRLICVTMNDKRRRYVPAVCDFDAATGVLVLELKPNARDFRDHHIITGRFSSRLASELAIAAARLHSGPPGRETEYNVKPFDLEPPWVLSAHRPTIDDLVGKSPACLEIVKLLQYAKEIGRTFDSLKSHWSQTCWIHGDLKWDNCLVYREEPQARRSEIAIVDWETAGVGDPCWDIASIVSDYLAFWVLSMPITGQSNVTMLPETARYAISTMQPAIRVLWRSYASARSLEGSAAFDFLGRSVRYIVARLVQIAFEQMQMRTELTGNMVALVQLARNIAVDIDGATNGLLGIGAAG